MSRVTPYYEFGRGLCYDAHAVAPLWWYTRCCRYTGYSPIGGVSSSSRCSPYRCLTQQKLRHMPEHSDNSLFDAHASAPKRGVALIQTKIQVKQIT